MNYSPTTPYETRPTELRKGMAIASLVLGLLGLPTFGLLLIGSVVGIGIGVLALIKASSSPGEYGGKGMAIAGIVLNGLALVLIPVIGIVAAIAIPSLLRARVSANEASAIGDIRTVISAEAAYQSVNSDLFDTPECLGTPSRCIPGYTGTTFLDSPLASLTPKSGYTRTFHPGPAPDHRRAAASPSSLQSYAYVAVPITPGTSGTRAFCGDSTGRICSTTGGTIPEVTDGQCAPSCTSLR